MNQYIRPSIVEQINYKKNLLDRAEHKTKLCKMFRQFEEAAEVEAVRHSLWIEKQDENPKVHHYNVSKKENKKAINNNLSALLWACNNLKPGKLNKEHICMISGMIDPEFWNKYAKDAPSNPMYRLIGVRPGGRNGPHTPPYPEKIPGEMNRYFEELNNLLIEAENERKYGNYNKVLAAAGYSHFHLLRIHPFEDTNGRTSRILQNSILKYFGFPPATIFGGEKADYIEHIITAKDGYLTREGGNSNFKVSSGEFHFYGYISNKVNVNLDRILGKEIIIGNKGFFRF